MGTTIRGSISITPPSRSRRRVTQRRAFGEAWAALSVGLLIAALAVIVWFRILPPPLAIVVLLGSYLAIESFFDRNVVELVLRITVILAFFSMVILAVTYLRELLLAGLLGPRPPAHRGQHRRDPAAVALTDNGGPATTQHPHDRRHSEVIPWASRPLPAR